MLKISKLTDYGLLAAVHLVRKSGSVVSARDLATFYSLPVPVVSKVMKTLQEAKLIRSHRGVGGGYSFEGDPDRITLAQLLEVFEGPWDLVDCETLDPEGHAVCSIRCPSRKMMGGINRTIKTAFDRLTLGDLSRGTEPARAWLDDPARIPKGAQELQ